MDSPVIMVEMTAHSVWSQHQWAEDERLGGNRTALMRSERLLGSRVEIWNTSEVMFPTSHSERMVNLCREHPFHRKVWISTKDFQDEIILLTFHALQGHLQCGTMYPRHPYQQEQEQYNPAHPAHAFFTFRQYLFFFPTVCVFGMHWHLLGSGSGLGLEKRLSWKNDLLQIWIWACTAWFSGSCSHEVAFVLSFSRNDRTTTIFQVKYLFIEIYWVREKAQQLANVNISGSFNYCNYTTVMLMVNVNWLKGRKLWWFWTFYLVVFIKHRNNASIPILSVYRVYLYQEEQQLRVK